MELVKENVLDVLAVVMEPDLKKDIVSANLVEDLKIENNSVSLKVLVSNPALHARRRMQEAVEFNLKNKFGKNLEIVCEVAAMPAKEIESANQRKILPEVKHIVAIASGKGGVGKSTITANLAGGLAKAGFKVGIVDADIYGPSMPTMFDVVEDRPTMLDIDGVPKINPVMSHGIKILSIGFFTDQDNAVVWRGPMASKALTQMFTDAHWGELDYLLIDLPPGTGDIHLSLVQTVPLDGAIIVSTPQEVALADARRGVNMFKLDTIKVPVLGIIENMAWFTPAELPDNKYYIFGRDGAKNLAAGMDVPFLGQIPLVQGVREAGDVGRPAVFQENTPISEAFDELVRKFVERVKTAKDE
ncbi:Mrp/NBP35 family ATP-binding protein [Crocinitomicaceae bacterium]|nr:Mrp/NBP35 family ATP-binding protein [Crocinitomicaceae bacterium]MDC0099308.1 Mrp/NBP35 family ATP-binding protein [Crocinitomicaceae bacterium]MDC1282793.1 Mrp/NBP35 family ATP-binding protein [Crocinitomicaceae bacterium]MDC1385580.1 Mrp/NBP35 family ATP-binding protein [Crocinitomicaceae bacterium]|tara:strand:- start:20589 stop:21662 length:1074 start_codon:yes stop_codon:yes gene_type:complete